jgi:RNA polymerase sigma-70 factor (ECF subfamily)
MSMPAAVASFIELVDRHRGEILGYLVRLLGDEDDAEDVCQETFLRAQRAFARLRPESNTRAWLYRIATNSGISAAQRRARAQRRRAEVDLDTLVGADGLPERRAQLRAVAEAAARLPPRQRAALVLRQFHGLGYEEIAASVGGNATTARANVYQALKKLRATLGDTP